MNRYDQFIAIIAVFVTRTNTVTDLQAIHFLYDAMQVKAFQIPDNVGSAAAEYATWWVNGKMDETRPEWMREASA